MSNINELRNIPDISFIDYLTLEQVRDQIISDYTAAYTEEQGVEPEIYPGTPERLILYTFAQQFYQALQYIDRAGKMGLLKYSEGDWLDNLAAIHGITRRPALPATASIKFNASDIRTSAIAIPGGTRVAAGSLFFATDTYAEIPAGAQSVIVKATAVDTGSIANGIPVGDINKMVDVVPYIASVENTTISANGVERETDDNFTRRIYLSNTGYSVAGPLNAYIFHAQNALTDIGDIKAYSPEPGSVRVVFLMSDGSSPTSENIDTMEKYLSADDIRPLTDTVEAIAPTEVDVSISLSYYINKSDDAQATTIQQKVAEAVEAYKLWQRKIGRDITPSKLIQLVMEAGAKRVTVTSPVQTEVEDYEVANFTAQTVTYGGLEND